MRIRLLILILLTTPLLAQSGEEQARRGIRELRARMSLTQGQLDQANSEEKEMAAVLSQTQTRLDAAQAEFDQVQARHEQATARLRKIRRNIGVTRARLRRVQGKLERRLRDLYMEGEVSYLAVLLQSDDFTDFLNQADYLKMILDTDHELVQEVRHRREELERQKAAAKKTADELAALKEAKRAKVTELEKLKAVQSQNMAKIRAHRRRLAASVDELAHSTRSLERRLQAMLAARETPPGLTPQSAGRFIYPVNGPVTSPFGYRFHPIRRTTRFHSGVDFGVGSGVPILAADNGVVIHSGWYGGYGNCVILSHSGGYTTLYAHCSRLHVNVGQSVAQGHHISDVGSTGMSTGPHLHFEVRRSGTPVNPLGRL